MAAIIFDFDGTIADSFETVVQIFHDMTGRTEQLTETEVQRLRGLSLTQVVEELDIPAWKIPFLLLRGRRLMGKQIGTIQSFPGVPGVIRKLYDEGHQLFIVSSNSSKNIRKFLQQHQMKREFVAIHGNVGLLSKARILKRVTHHNGLDPTTTWYVGDEVRDIVGAHQAALPIVSVSWGYNNADILRQHEPTHLVTTPAELLNVLEEI